ncbi:MAG: propanediol utilization microcompartment protein PduB [Eubacterium sp.]|nr:propanediol utilization microcompartment protein PduB [Eubacterium sp.]
MGYNNNIQASLGGKQIQTRQDMADKSNCKEFIGTAALDTIGMVIAGVDNTLLENMHVDKSYRALGILTARCGAAGQFLAMDDAVKMTNTEVVTVELPLDAKTWGGHGCYVVVGADSVEDCRNAVQIALRLTDKYVGEVYMSDSGHLEFCYSASAGKVLEKAVQAERGKAYGFMTGSPAGIGLVMADNALKASPVDLIWEMSPHHGTTHFSNEVMISFKGDAGNVWEAVMAGRRTGLDLLGSFGNEIVSATRPYYDDL